MMIKSYDNDLRTLPHVPFIVEIPDLLCFIIEIPMSKAEQDKHLPYFELIRINIKGDKIKHVGHKCTDFIAYSTKFKLIGEAYSLETFVELINDDGTIRSYELIIETLNWKAQPESEINDPYLSLDETPATGYEAWEIYSKYLIHQYQTKINEIVDDLNNNKIKPDYIKNRLPELYDHYLQSKRIDNGIDFSLFEQAIVRHAITETPAIDMKNKKCSRQTGKVGAKSPHEALSNINLINSYLFKLENYPADKKLNKSELLRETLLDFYPDLTRDKLADIEKQLLQKINRWLKKEVLPDFVG